jgi:AcrR family transcriptional regulator
MQAKTVSRTQEERTAEAKERLREAALFLFSKDGYEATSLAAISLRAGFSRTLAQYHYADRSELALEILEDHILRDNHIALIECPNDVSAEAAWEILKDHLEALKQYYGTLHGKSERDVWTTGGMAIHAAALTSGDEKLSARVEQLSREQVARIQRILTICQKEGFLDKDADARATAVFYVHSVWGLAQALFASPKAKSIIMAAFEQFGQLLESLRSDAKE